MNKQEILQLNRLPEGKAPWLSYDAYLELKRLFEAAPLPAEGSETDQIEITNEDYRSLYWFLIKKAGLDVTRDETVIHFNAFALIRRGYKVETITPPEYSRLCHLMIELEVPDIDDMRLYEAGGHRDLYNFLTKTMGLPVPEGRGPVWHRARTLIKQYEIAKTKR